MTARSSSTGCRRAPCRTGWTDALPTFDADEKGIATRKASGEILTAVAPLLPELWGGSADLAGSNNTTPKGEPSFVPPEHATKMFPGDWYGRVLHFGIREHAMGSILNGIALHGGTRPYGGTFLVFSDYMRPAVRLAALMKLPVTYVWTHDSIGLGEDGPTHQPIEHLAALRAIPGLDVVRPGRRQRDGRRMEDDARAHRPAGRARADAAERPDVPARHRRLRRHLQRRRAVPTCCSTSTAAQPDVVLIGTGSEVQIAVAAREQLADDGHPRPRGLDAVPRVVRGAGQGLPRLGHPAHGQGPGLGRGRGTDRLARDRRRLRPDRLASTTSVPPPTTSGSTLEFGLTAEAVTQAAKDSIAAADASG